MFKFFYKGKNIKLDVIECRSVFSKAWGLMFMKNSKPLLFYFNKPVKEAIHSFFCVSFVAIWFFNDKIIDIKAIKPYQFYIKPREKFDKLLEIPNTDDNFKIFLED